MLKREFEITIDCIMLRKNGEKKTKTEGQTYNDIKIRISNK